MSPYWASALYTCWSGSNLQDVSYFLDRCDHYVLKRRLTTGHVCLVDLFVVQNESSRPLSYQLALLGIPRNALTHEHDRWDLGAAYPVASISRLYQV